MPHSQGERYLQRFRLLLHSAVMLGAMVRGAGARLGAVRPLPGVPGAPSGLPNAVRAGPVAVGTIPAVFREL